MIDNLLRFKKVVEAGSINKASRLLYVSQPALSKSIQMLEQQFGVEILERHYNGTKTTVFGEILYQGACEIERQMLELNENILAKKREKLPDSINADINIGCSTIWNDFLLPETMRTLDILNSSAIHVTVDTSENLLEDLTEGDHYDFALCRIIENSKHRNLESVPLFKTQAAVFTSRYHPIFSSEIEKEELQSLKWVKMKSMPLLPRKELTPAGISFFPDSFFPPRIAYEVEDLMAAIQLVHDNYAVLLPLAIEKLVAKYDVIPLPFPQTLTKSYWLGIVYRRDRELPVNIQEVMNKIQLLHLGTPRI
jgi:DNA-binding transcriptional LysR family regulator